jgi:Ca2+/H+ antiporter
MTAIVLGIIYILYLIFQLFTHSEMFVSENTGDEHEEPEEPALSAAAAGSV